MCGSAYAQMELKNVFVQFELWKHLHTPLLNDCLKRPNISQPFNDGHYVYVLSILYHMGYLFEISVRLTCVYELFGYFLDLVEGSSFLKDRTCQVQQHPVGNIQNHALITADSVSIQAT